MFFSWLDVEIGKIYRQECITQAHNYRLTHRSPQRRKVQAGIVRQGLTQLGEWLVALGRYLQGMQINNGKDLSTMGPKGASYE
jgi:hypothetical protein